MKISHGYLTMELESFLDRLYLSIITLLQQLDEFNSSNSTRTFEKTRLLSRNY